MHLCLEDILNDKDIIQIKKEQEINIKKNQQNKTSNNENTKNESQQKVKFEIKEQERINKAVELSAFICH
jgi:hypothetical protein